MVKLIVDGEEREFDGIVYVGFHYQPRYQMKIGWWDVSQKDLGISIALLLDSFLQVREQRKGEKVRCPK